MTSYDYDAPIDEYGRPTAKFRALREVLAEYADGPLPEVPPAPASLGAPAEAVLTGWTPLTDVLETLGGPEASGPVPATFEELGVERGLVRYEVTVPGPREPYPLTVRGLRDLAVVYVDGERAGVLTEEDPCLKEPVAGHARVELWVESLGRVNYGPRLGESKGITGVSCTSGSSCTAYARVRCGWRRWRTPGRYGRCRSVSCPGTVPRGSTGAPSRCGAPVTPVWSCRA